MTPIPHTLEVPDATYRRIIMDEPKAKEERETWLVFHGKSGKWYLEPWKGLTADINTAYRYSQDEAQRLAKTDSHEGAVAIPAPEERVLHFVDGLSEKDLAKVIGNTIPCESHCIARAILAHLKHLAEGGTV